jgi:hypothetical protein
MVITFAKHKGDETGEQGKPKHVYANPASPAICPVLALALYELSAGPRNKAEWLFQGEARSTESRFSKWLQRACADMADSLATLGVAILEVGTHSFRKGVASFLTSCPGGATAIAIYLRAGWSLGPVQSRYILEGEGGDQLCGRAASGLSLLDLSFGCLPPHFDDSAGLVHISWHEVIPNFDTLYPNSFKPVMRMLLASVIYHEKYIRDSLPSHPVLQTPLFTSATLIPSLRDKVAAGTFTNNRTGMKATGIPPQVLLAERLAHVESTLEGHKVEVITRIDSLPARIRDELLNSLQINGAVPITRDQVVSLVEQLGRDIVEAVRSSGVGAAPQQQLQQQRDRVADYQVRLLIVLEIR